METTLRKYKVAGLVFEADIPDCSMSSYEPFIYSGDVSKEDLIFSLKVRAQESVVPELELLKVCNDEPPYLWLYRKDKGKDEIVFGFSFDKKGPFGILKVPETEKQIKEGANGCTLTIRKGLGIAGIECAISNAMMLLFAMFGTPKGAMMMHASAVMYPASVANRDNMDGKAMESEAKGVIFLGKSGTGKSTHLQLWLDNINDTERLNDDNPIVRLIDGKPYVFGSPWSGKTPCYKNKFLPLESVVQLAQAPYNKITRLDPVTAYTYVMPSCSSIRWRRDLSDALHESVSKVIGNCGVFYLECLPDADAALTCFKQVVK